ncbi:hypothetical protein FMEAI12_4480019 [Parafrankia sp. Ea1.12]|nr:hypothetical protein FMEAI12_4480019 [Parafrankia sp. Ea1.12]
MAVPDSLSHLATMIVGVVVTLMLFFDFGNMLALGPVWRPVRPIPRQGCPRSVRLVELACDEWELCFEEHQQLLLELPQRDRGDSPHDWPVDLEVCVNGDVAESCDGPPRQLGPAPADLGGNTSSRLADHQEFLEDGALDQIALQEGGLVDSLDERRRGDHGFDHVTR